MFTGKRWEGMPVNYTKLFNASLACLIVVVAVSQHALGQGKARVVSATGSEIVVDYRPLPYSPREVTVGGNSYLYFPESEVSRQPGEPGLPQESFVVGIPATGKIRLSVLDETARPLAALPVAPVATQVLVSDPVQRIIRDHRSQRAVSPFTDETVELAGIYRIRNQRIALIRVNPFKYRGQELIATTSVRVSITIEAGEVAGQARTDPLFEGVYKDLLVNYEQAKSWRTGHSQASGLPADPSADWFSPGGAYLKILAAHDGIVSVPFSVVSAFLPPSPDPRLFDLFYKGRSIPLAITGEADGVFGPGDTLFFAAMKLRDSTGSADEYSDTSVYWISFTGTGSQRTRKDTIVSGSPDITLSRTFQRIRLEKDSIYYFGDFGLPANNQTENVAGEGWYWRRLFAGQSTAFTLDTRNHFLSGNPDFLIRGRFNSPVANAATPNHNIEVSLNNTVLGNIQFPGNSDTVFTLTASSSLFAEGVNTIRVRSLATAATVNEIYLDWLEADLLKTLSADSDTLLIIPNEGSLGQTALFQIGGFTQPDISIYRIDPWSGLEKEFRGTVSGTPGNYAITFSDTLTAGRQYIALTQARKRSPDGLAAKTMGNLRSSSLGADYLVITGTSLKPQADRLAQYRGQRRGWRTYVATVEDIYDEFNFGHVSPLALRSFLQAADSFWIAPEPAVVVMFGDANWDFKDNLGTRKPNVVPSYGNPVSDNWFVELPGVPYLPQKQIGRIPAATLVAATDMVDMIIEYEANPRSLWNKTFMLMASGFNSTETSRFLQFSNQLIDSFLTSNPIAGRASRLYKTVTNVVEFELTEDIKRMLDDGAVWINFYGHAGTEFWGNGISNAQQLINAEGKRHLVSDISCSTVRFAEPLLDSFAERLLGAASGGAVGYLGSSGFGFESPLRTLANRLFQQVSVDTTREPGVLLQKAKLTLWQSGAGSMISQQALRQFSFLGDPAMELAVARRPDPAVDAAQFAITPEIPSEADQSVSVSIPVLNFGLSGPDSLDVRWTHTLESDPPEFINVRLPFPRVSDTVSLSIPGLKRGGSHQLRISVDPLNAVTEVTESNNQAEIGFFVTSGLLQLIDPLPSSSVHPDSVRLLVQNPNIPLTAGHRLRFEIDTTDAFSSPSKIVVPDLSLGILTTSWQAPPGTLRDSSTYFWRARVYEGIDSTDWGVSSFVTHSSLGFQWTQVGEHLLRQNVLTEVRAGSALELQQRGVPVEVLSTGFNFGNDVAIHVDGKNISMGFTNRGYNIAVVNQYSGVVESFAAFDILQSPDTAALASYLENIPAGRFVLAAISDEAAINKTERINQAFESIGSSRIRSVSFRASWAIIGRKGAAIGSVPEDLQASGSPITLRDTLAVKSIAGTALTASIGPAVRWHGISWDVDSLPGMTRVSLDIIRSRASGIVDTVVNVDPDNAIIPTILPDDVVSVRLLARLSSDSAGISPRLNRWSMAFDPPAELALGYQAIGIQGDSLLEGQNVTVAGSIGNLGPAPAESVVVAFSILGNSGFNEFHRTVIPAIAPFSVASFPPAIVSTAGKPLRSALLVFSDPDRTQRERFLTNNAVSFPLAVLRDTVAPMVDIRIDGQSVLDGDYVRPEPEIRITIRDNSPLPIVDPNSVVLRLDNRRVTLGAAPDSLFETLTGNEKARVTYRPVLAKGSHMMSVQVLDASGNPADTSAYEVRFNVETDLRLLKVFNFPNPFSSETAFTFHLTGLGLPEDVTLRVYTIAGRMIYERRLLPGEVNIGFNRIPWDGRDQNGDAISNGIYFYKISAVQEGKRVEVVEKLARMR